MSPSMESCKIMLAFSFVVAIQPWHSEVHACGNIRLLKEVCKNECEMCLKPSTKSCHKLTCSLTDGFIWLICRVLLGRVSTNRVYAVRTSASVSVPDSQPQIDGEWPVDDAEINGNVISGMSQPDDSLSPTCPGREGDIMLQLVGQTTSIGSDLELNIDSIWPSGRDREGNVETPLTLVINDKEIPMPNLETARTLNDLECVEEYNQDNSVTKEVEGKIAVESNTQDTFDIDEPVNLVVTGTFSDDESGPRSELTNPRDPNLELHLEIPTGANSDSETESKSPVSDETDEMPGNSDAQQLTLNNEQEPVGIANRDGGYSSVTEVKEIDGNAPAF